MSFFIGRGSELGSEEDHKVDHSLVHKVDHNLDIEDDGDFVVLKLVSVF